MQEDTGGLLLALEKPAKDGGGIRPIICGESCRRCLASLAASRQLRHVVLKRQLIISSEREALQEVCDRVVGAWRRHELVREVKRRRSHQAWAYMLEHAV